MKNQLILQIGGGRESLPLLLSAKRKGYSVIVLDKNPLCYCHDLADEFISASIYNPEQALNAIKNFNKKHLIKGIQSLGVDAPETNATIANYLKLPSIPIEAAQICSNKILMKDYLTTRGINMPIYKEIFSTDDIIKFSNENGFPLVIKPSDSRGARGVLIINERKDIDYLFEITKFESKNKKIIVEKFCSGPQISSETIIINKKAHTYGLSDRNYSRLNEFLPHVIEDGGELPSRYAHEYSKIINSEVQKIANYLNIENGTIKGDIVIHNNKIIFIEIAPRLSGGYFASHEIPYSTNYNFLDAAIDISLGIKPNTIKNNFKNNKIVVQRYLFSKPGTIKNIFIPEYINNDKDVLYFEIYFKNGTIIEPTTSHPSRGGVIITTGNNIDEAIKKADFYLNSIEIIIV